MFRIGLALLFLPLHSAVPAAQVEREDLKPGVIAVYRDSTQRELAQLDAAIGLTLKLGESPHPLLSADSGTYRWEGYLSVFRAGEYRFSASLRGNVRVTLAGKDVLAAESATPRATTSEGPATKLDAGIHPLLVEFMRLPGSARLQLFWQSRFFSKEPIPHQLLGHLPAKTPTALSRDRLCEDGRFLVEDRSCVQCHRPESNAIAKGLSHRQGPDLSNIGGRVYAGWIHRWLSGPRKVDPAAVMPKMFEEGDEGAVEIYAVTRYLAALGGPLQPVAKAGKDEGAVKRGQQLFTTLGCAACHAPATEKRERLSFIRDAVTVPLSSMGGKTTAAKLAAFLLKPNATHPSGLMPSMLLDAKEANDLAQFLCAEGAQETDLPAPPPRDGMLALFRRAESRQEAQAAFLKLPESLQWLDLGRRLVIDKGCGNCHTIAPGGQALAGARPNVSFEDLLNPKKQASGCLSDEKAKLRQAPWFGFKDEHRAAVRAFLRDGATGPNTPAPPHAARATLGKFNCLACHQRDGEGGLTARMVEDLRKYEKAEFAEAVSPPPLTGVGDKLRPEWLRQVLTEAGRARPWMGLRMPQFGKDHVGHLPPGLAALDGADLDDTPRNIDATPAVIHAGQYLVGKSAFGCISCHDIANHVAMGTRGPDLASMTQRVRYDWYRRWMEQAQRMQPGTRMPTVFFDGASTATNVLGGKADPQAEAIWAYLSLGPTLPLPEGVGTPKGLVLVAQDRPVILRTFMPDAGTKSIAVGFPGGVNTVFDATQCRLAYAWTGSFLDVSPVWNNRGGAPAKLLGPKFWTAPPGFPWAVTDDDRPPDFAAQAKDPAFGASLPEGQVFLGRPKLFFQGYATATVDGPRVPIFEYTFAAGEQRVTIRESPESIRSSAGVGLQRKFATEIPARKTMWLFAAESPQKPRIVDARGTSLGFEVTEGAVIACDGNAVVLSDKNRATLVRVARAREGTQWRFSSSGGKWQVLVRLPAQTETTPTALHLVVWSVYRDEPGFLRELQASK